MTKDEKCEKGQHNYIEIEKGQTRKKNSKEQTEIHQTFMCNKCGDLISRHIATWDKYSKDKGVE